jgi:di/tricarboxylate transporter
MNSKNSETRGLFKIPPIIKKENYLKVLLTLLLPLSIIVINPMSMTANQCMILGSLFLTVVWWGTGWVYKDAASIFLLIIFVIFGGTPLKKVFYFPLSGNFSLVIASFLLSQGIVNSKVADKFSGFVLKRYCTSSIRLVIMSFVLGIVLIFLIPQPFPRVILLASIYLDFLKKTGVNEEAKKILVLSVFVASSVTSLMFLNGDVIINYSAMKFGGINLTYAQWAKYMALPTFITTIIIAVAFILVFKKNLGDKFEIEEESDVLKFDRKGKLALVITGLTISLWLTESFHGIAPANVAIIGVVLMYLTRIVRLKDLNVVSISLLIFLTAEFSIGKVLAGSGTASVLSEYLTGFFPGAESIFYIPFIIVLIMVLHSIMGSLVTATSVLIPTLITITAGNLSPTFIVLLSCVAICFHYILPFHHVSIMIGFGNGFYDNKHVIKLGGALTLITLGTILFVYMPWWKIVGVI